MGREHIFYRRIDSANPSDWRLEFTGWLGSDEWIDVAREVLGDSGEWHDASELGISCWEDIKERVPSYRWDYWDSSDEYHCASLAGAMVQKVLPNWRRHCDIGKDSDRFFSAVEGDYSVVVSLVPHQEAVNRLWEVVLDYYDSWDTYEFMTMLPSAPDLMEDGEFVDECLAADIDFKELVGNYGNLGLLRDAVPDVRRLIVDAVGSGHIELADALDQYDSWAIWLDSYEAGVPLEDIFA